MPKVSESNRILTQNTVMDMRKAAASYLSHFGDLFMELDVDFKS